MSPLRLQTLLFGLLCSLPAALSFQPAGPSTQQQLNTKLSSTRHYAATGDNRDDSSSGNSSTNNNGQQLRRDEFFSRLVTAPAIALLLASSSLTASPQAAMAVDDNISEPATPTQEGGITMYKTNTGLKYIELEPGTGPSPRYGQLCAIQYTAYLKLPTESKPQKYDTNSFLIKHGNGRIIAGLDEGLHTMKVGGQRRLIIPPKLGYVQSGLGPIPEMPWNRWALNGLLEKMIKQRGGNLVFEVELRSIIDDEADQGYYEDSSPTPAEFERLKLNFQERNSAAATAREAENDIL